MLNWVRTVIFCCVSIFICSFVSVNDRFDKVLENQSSQVLKKRLQKFRDGGIEKPVNTDNYYIDQVVACALGYKNTRHRMGGSSKKGIDCSGLVMVAHRQAGIVLPHHSQEQARYGRIIHCVDSLKRGDMVFFYNSYKTSSLITHSGIFLGDKEFVHASHTSGVVVSNINDSHYWGKRFLFGTRLCVHEQTSAIADTVALVD